jgi:hypothetical protein
MADKTARPAASSIVGGLDSIMNRTTTAPVGREDEGAVILPGPGDDYRAAGRQANHGIARIHFILGDRTICFGQYAELDSFGKFFPATGDAGESFVICFKARVPMEIVVEGRNLWSVFDYISVHRMPWVRELAKERDFEDETTTVIHRITIRPVSPEPRAEP